MTSDNYANTYTGDTRAGGDTRRQPAVKAGESGIYPSYIITLRNSKTAMYLFNEDDYAKGNYYHPAGIACLMDGHAVDTAYTSGDLVEWFAIGQDVDVWVHCIADTPAPSYQAGGDIIASTTDGYGKIWTSSIFAYSYDYLAGPLLKIGKVVEYKAGSTSDTKLVKVNLSG